MIDKEEKRDYDINTQFFEQLLHMILEEPMKYVCELCGYVYDAVLGDPENGVDAGTDFEDIPEDWSCPLCGAGKDDFEAQNDSDD